jgi:hypothetical protein
MKKLFILFVTIFALVLIGCGDPNGGAIPNTGTSTDSGSGKQGESDLELFKTLFGEPKTSDDEEGFYHWETGTIVTMHSNPYSEGVEELKKNYILDSKQSTSDFYAGGNYFKISYHPGSKLFIYCYYDEDLSITNGEGTMTAETYHHK